MQDHPVPQQISSYSFKLVGDMTLKQFFEVAGGVGVAILFYISGLPIIIKWPLILISALMGAALAFIPFEERPLEQWIFAFFRSIYSPTLFYWKKDVNHLIFFQESAVPTQPLNQNASQTPQIGLSPQVAASATTQPEITVFANLENTERAFLSQINNLFKTLPTITLPKSAPKTAPLPPRNVNIPQSSPVSINRTQYKETLNIDPNLKPNLNAPTVKVAETLVAQPLAPNAVPQTAQVSPQTQLPPQSQTVTITPPTQANTITGQILDSDGKILEGAIVEIKDASGRPARALKSNKAGYFLVTIPFSNGQYQLLVEKEGLTFTPVSFEAKGEIIPPFVVKGTKSITPPQNNIFAAPTSIPAQTAQTPSPTS